MYYFGKPFIPFMKAQQASANSAAADQAVDLLYKSNSNDFGSRLAAAALQRTKISTTYERRYLKLDRYPGGDVPANTGCAEDLIVRSYRSLGIDLQQLVHEDMVSRFSDYPQLFREVGPDSNIDHRRAANLARFFELHGEKLPGSYQASDYKPGDIVVWRRPGVETLSANSGGSSNQVVELHIGIVAPGPGPRSSEPWVVHHLEGDVKWENSLFSFEILGHYRYPKIDK